MRIPVCLLLQVAEPKPPQPLRHCHDDDDDDEEEEEDDDDDDISSCIRRPLLAANPVPTHNFLM